MTVITDISPVSSNTNAPDYNHSVNGRMLSLACSPDGRTIFSGSYAGLWTSSNQGRDWEQLTWEQPSPDQYDASGALGGSTVGDIAVGPGWRVDRHPRFVVPLQANGPASIVGFGECGVWTALGDGQGGFAAPKVVLAAFGQQAGGWQVTRHPRFIAVLTDSGFTDIVGFGDAGVWTALGNGDGTFQSPNYVIAGFGYDQGWRVNRHPRFLADLTGNGLADIVGFGARGVVTALGDGAGGFVLTAGPVFPRFGYQQGWRISRHPRVLANLSGTGTADIVGFGEEGVWTAIGNGDGTFQDAKRVLPEFGAAQGWRVDRHPRSLAVLTPSGFADIVGFASDGVWTAIGDGLGGFRLSVNPVLGNFGYDQSWRVGKHPRVAASLTPGGPVGIVGFGDAGVWTATGTGDGGFNDARYVLANLGVDQGWRVDRHPRFVTSLAPGMPTAVVAFGDAGVWTAIGDGVGGVPGSNYVLANFGFGLTVLALMANDLTVNSRGLWRSTDGGANWSQAYRFAGAEILGQIEWAPGSDHLVYAVGSRHMIVSRDAGATFEEVFPWGVGKFQRTQHIALWQENPADPAPTVIYAVSRPTPNAPNNTGMSWSFDGGVSWLQDLGDLPAGTGGPTGLGGNSNSAKTLVVSPRFPLEVFLAGDGSDTFTPAALWRGDFTQFPFGSLTSSWDPVVLPDALEANIENNPVFQDSGNVFIATTKRDQGDLLFYGAQRSFGFVGPLYPDSGTDWRILDDGPSVHYDLHGILLSPDFAAKIEGGDYRHVAGDMWMVSDGGLYRSTDGGLNFDAAHGVKTLSCVSVAGSFIAGRGPALSLNSGDNDGFYSMDGGRSWSYQQYGGGDNDCAFADPMRPGAMLVFTPRWDTAANPADRTRHGQTVSAYEAAPGTLPNAAAGGHDRVAVVGPPVAPDSIPDPAPDIWNASSGYGLRGSRPIVLGLATQVAPPQGDYVFILFFTDAPSVVVRTQNIKDIKHRYEWLTTATGPGQGANVYLQGPPLPPLNLGVLQTAGGHDATVFYVGGDTDSTLWTWTAGAADWTQIVPAPIVPNVSVGVQKAIRFFVSPYQPNVIHVLDTDHVKRSDDGGVTWQIDDSLETQLTWDKRIDVTSDGVLTDMQFDPYHDLVRFAVGLGGAFGTVDGATWTRLLHTGALPGQPVNCVFDPITNPNDPALYVAFAGRSLVKITDLPPPPVIIF